MAEEILTNDVKLQGGELLGIKPENSFDESSRWDRIKGIKKETVRSPDGNVEVTAIRNGATETRVYEQDGFITQRVELTYINAKSDMLLTAVYKEPLLGDMTQMEEKRRVVKFTDENKDYMIPENAVASDTYLSTQGDEKIANTSYLNASGKRIGRAVIIKQNREGMELPKYNEIIHEGKTLPTLEIRDNYDSEGNLIESVYISRGDKSSKEERTLTVREGMIPYKDREAFAVTESREIKMESKDEDPSVTYFNARKLYDRDPKSGGKMIQIDASSQHVVADEIKSQDAISAEFKYSEFGNLTSVEEFLPDGNTVIVYVPEGINIFNKKTAGDFPLHSGTKEGFIEKRRYELNPVVKNEKQEMSHTEGTPPEEISPEDATHQEAISPVESDQNPLPENNTEQLASVREELGTNNAIHEPTESIHEF